ncbi:MAG: hypothetical protein LBP23_10660 [Treponema sp.]|jgi:hypothetical protein|nr:hypothetical protein [Treponema sp.]
MASISWPADLPATLLLEGLSAKQESNTIRTQMDAGPGKVRRRYTANTKVFTGKLLLTPAQRTLLEQFYHTALADGVLRFNFTNPLTMEVQEFRFTADYTESALDGLFEIAVSLERL